MAQVERQQIILNLLKDFQGIEPLKELFWRELNYERINESLSRRAWADTVSSLLTDDPVLFASGGSDSAFHVIYTRVASDTLFLGPERLIVNRLLKEHPYALFVVSNAGQDKWHFINVRYDEEEKKRKVFRRITVSPHERLRTASERIVLLDLEKIGGDLFGVAPLAIQKAHDEAFDVEAVTEQFFEEYKATFNILQRDLVRQTKDTHWAHDYSLQFLNRCMFLYFIQRKGWLNEDREFLRTFWETYWRSNRPDNSFVDEWLTILFFEAFNNKFHGGYRQFPPHIKDILQTAPYLNGGLFKKNRIDELHNFAINDQLFKQIFTFLERYNFTIAEDSPLDQEVAVDPEMIGKVYESLVNVSEEATERGDAGIFYTPRIEIDLMCRLSLVDYLANHLGDNYKSLLYQFVFAIEEDDKDAIDNTITKARLWEQIQPLIADVTVLDPACGSGSFLVGMLNILNDLQERVQGKLKVDEDVYERKKRIIGQSLYGVDVMEWACHVAELRLWLALIGDAEIEKQDLHVRNEPLLPHFSFKIRCGDSLVQEIGGVQFFHRRQVQGITQTLKGRITKLKIEKLKFYNNIEGRKYSSDVDIKHEEKKLFNDILENSELQLREKIRTLQISIDGDTGQMTMPGVYTKKPRQMALDAAKWQKEMDLLKEELNHISHSRVAMMNQSDINPFVWDIAFVEIFEGEKGGFDIVIGNPPYVRQENIADPKLPREKITTENKKVYKSKLAISIYNAFPYFFNSNRRLDAKSDLYIYFYFHGLSLLNKKGSFCFITSNSWLDVGYGKDLQEFLLKQCHVKMIIDNQVKRSFASADVNTIIALFSAPDDRIEWASDKTAKFIMFKVPFESIFSAVVFDEIEEIRERKNMPEYRVYPVKQEALLGDGCEVEEESSESGVRSPEKETPINTVKDKKSSGILIKSAKYIGNKWGGKYLRAPDIYWTILEKGKGKLVRLGDIAEVRRGFTTGADDWFYLTAEKANALGIEKEYLEPILTDPGDRNVPSIVVTKRQADLLVIKVNKEKKELQRTNLLAWIVRGENEKFKGRGDKSSVPALRPTLKSRKLWYALPHRNPAPILWIEVKKRRSFTLLNQARLLADRSFYDIIPQALNNSLCCALLNSTMTALFCEAQGNAPGGSGAGVQMTTAEVRRIMLLKPKSIGAELMEILQNGFNQMCNRFIGPIYDDILKPDRHILDSVIFETLKLTQGEQDAVYEAVINLVESRLKKAGSV